jgi:hypothetical protein
MPVKTAAAVASELYTLAELRLVIGVGTCTNFLQPVTIKDIADTTLRANKTCWLLLLAFL